MIIVTEEAKRLVRTTARAAEISEGMSLRLEKNRTIWHDEPKVVMEVGEPREGDEPVELGSDALLYVSPVMSATYDGCVLDLEETPKGMALTLGPPGAGTNARG